MTTPGWAERAARTAAHSIKPVDLGSIQGIRIIEGCLKAEHARAVRICKKLEKQALEKQEPDCTRCYLQGVRDVLAALQRGRG
jgi:hypothetical protein